MPSEDMPVVMIDAINALREEEGASVEIMCSNPDPETADGQEAVEVHGSWTNWQPRRFTGRTLGVALAEAVYEMNLARSVEPGRARK